MSRTLISTLVVISIFFTVFFNNAFANEEWPKAVIEGDTSNVTRLVASGIDINQRVQGTKTALMVAAQKGYLDIAELLVRKGADVNLKSGDTNTALVFAAENKNNQIVQLLLAAGSQVPRDVDLREDAFFTIDYLYKHEPTYYRRTLAKTKPNSSPTAPPVIARLHKPDTESLWLLKRAAVYALNNRRWLIDRVEGNKIYGIYVKNNDAYQVVVDLSPTQVKFSFVPGYGHEKPNWLLNLEQDLLRFYQKNS